MRKYGEGTAKMLEEWLEDKWRDITCPFNNGPPKMKGTRQFKRYCIDICSARFKRVNKKVCADSCPCEIYALSTVEREARKFIREIREEK